MLEDSQDDAATVPVAALEYAEHMPPPTLEQEIESESWIGVAVGYAIVEAPLFLELPHDLASMGGGVALPQLMHSVAAPAVARARFGVCCAGRRTHGVT